MPSAKRPGLVPVLVRVPGNTMTYVRDAEDKSGKKMQRADFAVVVRIKNQANREVDRLSQRYVLSVPKPTWRRPARATSSSTGTPILGPVATRWRRWATTRWLRRRACRPRFWTCRRSSRAEFA
jgi:hypothetical protein